MDVPLRTRHREVLHAIVRTYIESGEPVGSRVLSKRRSDTLSPASIRNVMADLADEGYLSQPHTSAGRIPTEKAFRFYVRSLEASRMGAGESDRLRDEFNGLHTVGARVERSSHILVELTRNVGIAAALPAVAQELDQIELVPLSDRRVMMILATRDRMVRNRVVSLEQELSQEELASIRNYVNRNFSGWQLGEARRELLRRMAEERALYDAGMRNLQIFYQKGMLDVDISPEVHMEGASNLLGLDLHLTREKLRELLRALEIVEHRKDVPNQVHGGELKVIRPVAIPPAARVRKFCLGPQVAVIQFGFFGLQLVAFGGYCRELSFQIVRG